MSFTGHGVAQDYSNSIRIERPLGVAVIFQSLARGRDCPLLRQIHGIGHTRWNRQMPLHWIPVPLAHPAADLRISLVRSTGIGGVVKRRIPTILRDLLDAVTSVLDVFPERRHVDGIGQ